LKLIKLTNQKLIFNYSLKFLFYRAKLRHQLWDRLLTAFQIAKEELEVDNLTDCRSPQTQV